MKVLAVVQGYLTEHARVGHTEANVELSVAKAELKAICRKAVSLEFELASEQERTDEAQQACTTANERLEEDLVNNEELRDLALKDKEEIDTRVTDLEKALAAAQGALGEKREKQWADQDFTSREGGLPRYVCRSCGAIQANPRVPNSHRCGGGHKSGQGRRK
ncbi:hypothetical protein CsSME_00031777 [Camellia sinensis var. sinensis]